eukprot:IDg10287t1
MLGRRVAPSALLKDCHGECVALFRDTAAASFACSVPPTVMSCAASALFGEEEHEDYVFAERDCSASLAEPLWSQTAGNGEQAAPLRLRPQLYTSHARRALSTRRCGRRAPSPRLQQRTSASTQIPQIALILVSSDQLKFRVLHGATSIARFFLFRSCETWIGT